MRWRSFVRKRKRVSDGSAKAEPDIVILIHGTGAADPDPISPKWWEPESAYAKDLRERLGPDFEVGTSEQSAPFKWSGANSEKDRRRAGRKLAARLNNLERDGRKYHLVGHSHGGSVIWHALWQSNMRFDGLKSWTSVGTPYLEFSPVWTGVTTIVTLLLVALLTYGPALQILEALQARDIILRDGSPLGVFTTVALSVLLLLLFVGFAIAAVRWIVRHILIWRQRRREKRAVDVFADRWLGVWHPEDEPIAGLNASLISPLDFVPRLATPNSNWLWRFVTWPFNRIIAPATDQFVWTVLMRRLQGADISGSVMVDAGSAPIALSPGWRSMPNDLASAMVLSAGKQAPHTIENLRKRLSEMRGRGSGHEAFGQLSSAITWTEILHTSYFDIQPVCRLISDHIEKSADSPEASDVAAPSPLLAWLTERPRAETPQLPKPFRPVLLNFAKIAVFGGLAMLLFTGFKSAYDAYVAPHTLDGQINFLAENATKREAMSGANVGVLGEVLVGLDLLGKLGDPKVVLERIPDANTRAWAGQRLAYHYAYNNNFAPIDSIARDAASLELMDPPDAVAFVYVHALAGARDAEIYPGRITPPAAFLDEAARKIFIAGYAAADVEKVRVFDPRQNYNYIWTVPAVEALEYFKHQPTLAVAKARRESVMNSVWLKPEEFAKAVVSEKFMTCGTLESAITGFSSTQLSSNVTAALQHCKDIAKAKLSGAATNDPDTGADTSAGCPTEAQLDTPSPRVGDLHFTWNQALSRIYDLLRRNCKDAAIAAIRRHIPTPVGQYETARPGKDLGMLAFEFERRDKPTAELITKYNLSSSPALIDWNQSGGKKPNIIANLCAGRCTADDLRSYAESYLAAVKLPPAPQGTMQIDFTKYRIEDLTAYKLGAAIIYADLDERPKSVVLLREALASVSQAASANDRYNAAFMIGSLAYEWDQDLGLNALAQASNLVYSAEQSGKGAFKTSIAHLALADVYFDFGEYRLAREAAEKAQDRLSVMAGLDESAAELSGVIRNTSNLDVGDGRAVLIAYKNILARTINKKQLPVNDQLDKRGPRQYALAKPQ